MVSCLFFTATTPTSFDKANRLSCLVLITDARRPVCLGSSESAADLLTGDAVTSQSWMGLLVSGLSSLESAVPWSWQLLGFSSINFNSSLSSSFQADEQVFRRDTTHTHHQPHAMRQV